AAGADRWSTAGITIVNSTYVTSVNGLFIDPGDTLYFVDETANAVVWKLDKGSTVPVIIAGVKAVTGSTAGLFSNPQAVYVDSKQNMYVSDLMNHRIQKFINGSTVGTTVAGITSTPGSQLNQLRGPRYLWVDPNEEYIYIAESDNSRVMRHRTNSTSGTDGVLIAGGNGQGNAITQLSYPYGIYYAPNISNYLYITNIANSCVMKWAINATSGTFVAGVPGTSGSNATLLNTPVGIKIDAFMNMFVVDNQNHRVQMFCNNSQIGITVAGNGVAGNTSTQLSYPMGIAFDSSLNMYITDRGNQRIQKFLKL
ncbi:unnamed protein product, partial [Adineta ricciae]